MGMFPGELVYVLGGGLLMAAFWVAVIYFGVRLARPNDSAAPPKSTAMQVLEERYARGEITREEFIERRDVLARTSAV